VDIGLLDHGRPEGCAQLIFFPISARFAKAIQLPHRGKLSTGSPRCVNERII
jgi:hypothetical protein